MIMDAVNFLNLEYLFLWLINALRNFDIIVFLNGIISFIKYLQPIAVIIALILVAIIIYTKIKMKEVVALEESKFQLRDPNATASSNQDTSLIAQWQEVERHINSNNPSDWRLAILEADIMLDEILKKQGYQGDTVGDKLKSVDKSSMTTIDYAWEAHKIRNQIAHEGVGFQINDREAKRVIGLFRKVFEEFYHL